MLTNHIDISLALSWYVPCIISKIKKWMKFNIIYRVGLKWSWSCGEEADDSKVSQGYLILILVTLNFLCWEYNITSHVVFLLHISNNQYESKRPICTYFNMLRLDDYLVLFTATKWYQRSSLLLCSWKPKYTFLLAST